jgi:hypothetical protein
MHNQAGLTTAAVLLWTLKYGADPGLPAQPLLKHSFNVPFLHGA